jgi:hypothetical protein
MVKKAKKIRPRRRKDPCEDVKAKFRAAGAIVAQVLTHFGAGYGSQRLSENPSGPLPDFQIFCAPQDIKVFYKLLLKSTLKHLATLNWDTDQPMRDAVCSAAFQHGVLARKTVVAEGAPCLTLEIILDTLETIHATVCPGTGAGGGLVCDF